MRVLMLTWEYPPLSVGGLARHVEDLAGELVKTIDLHILTRGETGLEQLADPLPVHRIAPYPLQAPDFLTWVLQLNMALLQEGVRLFETTGPFELVHAHDWLVAFAARALKHLYRIPLVATIHATEAGRNQGLHNDGQRYIAGVEWWLTYEAWRVIVCSEYMQQEVGRQFQLPVDKMAVIPNGVNPKKFQVTADPSFRACFAYPWEKIIFFVGRLVPEKGVQVLLQAMPAILRRCPEAKLVVAGQGPMEDALKNQAQSLGIGYKTHFCGYLDDTERNRLYACADVAVFPSLYEPFGIVALEAMAAGVPVVAADVGGLGEIVRDGENGLKARPGSASSLADHIARVLTDPGLADHLNSRAASWIKNVYNWEKIAGRTLTVYEEILREARRTGWFPESRVAAGRRSPYTLVEQRLGRRTGNVLDLARR